MEHHSLVLIVINIMTKYQNDKIKELEKLGWFMQPHIPLGKRDKIYKLINTSNRNVYVYPNTIEYIN